MASTARLGINPGTRDGYYYQPELETLPRSDLAALQLQRLKNLLPHAYENVPRYREKFTAAGVTPSDLESLDDLRRFPFTVKSDLRDAYPFGLFAVPREQLVRLHASSGTTGKSTVVGYTRDDLNTWCDLMARTLSTSGARPGDIVHNAFGYGLFTGGLGSHYGAERLGCTVIPMSGGNTEKQVLLLQDFGARVLCATPSYALNIAEVAEQMGVDLRATPLAVGFFGAEPWSEALRAELDRRLGIRAADNYGLSEIMGPGVAAECMEERAGLHGWEDHFLFEIIDPESGAPLPMGASGELVITTLTKQALPMIRYRTRDITRLTDEPCACGRTHVRILRVTGRNDDMLIIRGVNLYPSQVEAVLVGFAGIAPYYQLVVRREGSMDDLTVEVEAAPQTAASGYPALAQEIRHHIKSLIGVTCTVEMKRPGEVPRSQGKAVRVRDLRKN
ncbi:MAG: phenylacetate--CoA ligase [Proteobacteria bacterium]|nr:MAG: phenylacetate--CoA ligase [Pseudomonadota bacterium]